jgi:hypothetical protein
MRRKLDYAKFNKQNILSAKISQTTVPATLHVPRKFINLCHDFIRATKNSQFGEGGVLEYRIVGNYRMVQKFTDRLGATKIRTAKS